MSNVNAISNSMSKTSGLYTGGSGGRDMNVNNRTNFQTKPTTTILNSEKLETSNPIQKIVDVDKVIISENETLRQQKVDLLGRIKELEEKQNSNEQLIRKLELELASFRNRESMAVTDSKTEILLNEITVLYARNQDLIFNYMLEIIPNEKDSDSELFISLVSKSVYSNCEIAGKEEKEQLVKSWDQFTASISKRFPTTCHKILTEKSKNSFIEIFKNCIRIGEICENSRIPKIRKVWESAKAGMECISPAVVSGNENRVIVACVYSKYF